MIENMNNTSTSTSNKLANTSIGVVGAAMFAGFILGKIIIVPSAWVIIAIIIAVIYFKRR